jgi:hypothetical protein
MTIIISERWKILPEDETNADFATAKWLKAGQ